MTEHTSLKDVFFALIRAALTGKGAAPALDERALSALIRFGRWQGVLPLLYEGAKVCACGEDAVCALKEACDGDLFDFVLRDRAIRGVREALCSANVPFVPLKGAVLCELYPERWERTVGDVDVLVHGEDLERAAAAIEERTDLRRKSKNYHDLTMTGGGVCVELHFSICENSPALDPTLCRVWEYCSPVEGGAEHRMSEGFFAFHAVAHMSYHLAHGGLGVRPYLDLRLLRASPSYDEEFVRARARECGILKFYDAAVRLGEVWIDGAAHTPQTRDMERLCFRGGVFGSTRGAEAAMRREEGESYLLRRVFQPRSELAEVYPALEKRPYLTPYYQMKRWGAAMRRKSVKKKLRAIRCVSPEHRDCFERVISALELDV